MAEKALTGMQRMFVNEYFVDFNARQAAARAGYSLKNTSIGQKVLNTPHVHAEIIRRSQEIQVKLEMNGDDVRRGFARIATDPRSPDQGGPSYRDRISALTELGKIFGLYTNKIEVRGSLTLVDLLLAADRKSDQPAIEVTH